MRIHSDFFILVLWPKTQTDCDFQGECFWDIAGVGATCALDIAAGASLTPAMWAMVSRHCLTEVFFKPIQPHEL